nr:hypothetical protein [Tanacetum cinerariifolium]
LKHEIQHYKSSIKRDSVDYEFLAKAKELDDCSSFFFNLDKKKQKLMPNEAMSLSEQQQQEVAKFEDDVAQHLKKEKPFLFVCESVLSALMDDLREVEARIHMLEGEREEWQGEADAFLSKASNLRLQLLHSNEKKKLKIREFNTAKKKKQELHNDLGRLSETMIQNYEWIEGEKDRFGVSGGELDFKSMNFHAAKKEYDKLLANKAARQTVREISEQIERLQQEGERLEKRATELKV